MKASKIYTYVNDLEKINLALRIRIKELEEEIHETNSVTCLADADSCWLQQYGAKNKQREGDEQPGSAQGDSH